MAFTPTRLALILLSSALSVGVGLSGCSTSGQSPAVSAATQAVTEQNLQAAQWTALAIDGVAQVTAPKPTLRWTGPQQVVGSGGCNQFRGRALLGADGLRIGPIAGIGRACVTAPSGQEDLFFKAVENTRSARLENGQLVLLDASGKTLARFDTSSPN